TANFLNDVGEVLEKDGFGSAQVFLIGKLERGDEARQQANALLNVVMPELVKSPRVKQKRSIGRYILKILITLKTEEVKL
ncbi:MAG TPA: hypothetical protein VLH15_07800, partial [Dehalococcoidales bacterium]|nr:hypothetical protein [Dehalococcoidales bacterium]